MREVLHLLRDGEFHSGEALGALLGVSRAAVWKRLEHLESALGLSIHRVRGRGYRLASPLSLLEQEELVSESLAAGWCAEVLEVVDSTNAEVLRRLAVGAPAPLLVLAESQEGGRGRRGRAWVSPFAENLYYSLGLRLEGGAFSLDGLSLTVGLAVLRSLREAGLVEAGVKWPNDLLVEGRKIAGVLLELSGDPAGACQVAIGIGVNVNMLPGPSVAIDQPWTSVRECCARLVDRTALALALGRWLRHYLDLHEKGGFAALRDEWEACHLWQGREVSLLAGPQRIDGVVLGVDHLGALRLNVAGQDRQYSGGELSLRLRDDS
ncbi:bifunctional biotin--[acetyl-CoA-carboxylase] ligase/biotin operon repressor BirA [Pseudomonas sp. Gutcm_11s]|uniref:bifunctional biotin--[acetyl-CoA-carboxylase] ligase/biotin operon repressor BirA n=1 Tax=Pseudomonas sp. Gutcm_11s TaxID=3026088 RepID=UPI0023622B09|nr:bifunctional biotin--[acetyl-CoA-carboxylase] ligase/biotin operon repressor BirA [Pseudomonas sp. Gutcm_11s]MDD0841300.1 bifunctional biotin--[acetyl-CoA-carboxylase] ligase/biotin operon repressor BirA [Pseudomonas sp. Gutcm_11s]